MAAASSSLRVSPLLDLTTNGQLAFAFVLDFAVVRKEVEQRLSRDQMLNFDLGNRSSSSLDDRTARSIYGYETLNRGRGHGRRQEDAAY